ncbi:MAG: ACP S-malonyltransferase [Pirellulales bacterium]|jgi:[acyl-carrier-protein] S-malonyltransferase|nr:ACP S-malonyltransferase [Pirellulales bacterium]
MVKSDDVSSDAGSSAGGPALLFPGQGAQSVGMLGEWSQGHAACGELFAMAADILGYDLAAVCRSGPPEKLNTTAVSQPALLVTSLAALKVLESRDDSPLSNVRMAAGLSLGEYTALVYAGSLSAEDAIRVVAERGRAMQDCAEATPGGMVAVLGMEREAVAELCDVCRDGDVLEVANVLCPGNVVASGDNAACDRLEAAAAEAGAMRCVRLEVAGAFHTSRMQPAVERLAAALDSVKIHPPRLPVVSNVDARPHDDPAEIRQLLARQVCGVVEWNSSMDFMLAEGVDSFWEVGPGRVLRGLLKRIARKVPSHGALD